MTSNKDKKAIEEYREFIKGEKKESPKDDVENIFTFLESLDVKVENVKTKLLEQIIDGVSKKIPAPKDPPSKQEIIEDLLNEIPAPKNGLPGKPGARGEAGPPGKDGRDGTPGKGLMFRGIHHEHPKSPKEGHFYKNDYQKTVYIYDGKKWVSLVEDGQDGKGGMGSGVGPDEARRIATDVHNSLGAGQSNTASNVGTGVQLFKQKTGVDLEFRTLSAGPNTQLTSGSNVVTVSASSFLNGPTSPINGATIVWDDINGYWDATNNLLITSSGLIVPKTSGFGIKVDVNNPTFGYRDLTGDMKNRPDAGGGSAARPDYVQYRGNIYAYRFGTANPNNHLHETFIEFHMPHDYVPGTDMFIHVHWSQITVDTGGPASVPGVSEWTFEISYAKGYGTPGGVASAFNDPKSVTVTQQGSTTQYGHMIAEVQFTSGSDTSSTFDRNDMEIDGLFLVRLTRDPGSANDTLDQDTFVHFIDIHYQSTNIGTKDKNAPFYI